jgi:hypothetical protein
MILFLNLVRSNSISLFLNATASAISFNDNWSVLLDKFSGSCSRNCRDNNSFSSCFPSRVPDIIVCFSSRVQTRFPQKKQGPDPSCSHTIRPHLIQLPINLCFDAWHSHEFRP